MVKNDDFLNQIMDLLIPLGGVSSKAMFGGYGIFHMGDMFALIKGKGLFFKVDDSNRSDYEKAGSAQYRPMPYYQVPTELLEIPTELLDWARTSITIAHSSRKRKQT